MDERSLEAALSALGEVLADRGVSYDLVAIGGGALLLLGMSIRPTRDVDLIAQVIEPSGIAKLTTLPHPLAEAASDVARTLGLASDWLNTAAADIVDLGLPAGFVERTETRRFGPLTLRLASRRDQVFFKLYAAADSGPESKHLTDLRRLEPTRQELVEAARWATTHDPSPGFRDEALLPLLRSLGVEPSHGEL